MTIQDIIDKELEIKQEARSSRERSGKISPSLLGRCLRCQYWYRKNETPTNPPDSRSLRIFKCGSLFHDFVQKFLPAHQIEVLAETDDIKGFADIVVDDEVMDIKSVHSRQFHYLRKPKYDINKEKETNILQLMTYCWILKKEKGRLVFISKDDLCIAEYAFYLKNWRDKIQAEIDILRWHWENKELPAAKPRAYNGKEGKYCNYRDKCREFENGHKRDTKDHACFKV